MQYCLEENWDAPSPYNHDERTPDPDERTWYDKFKDFLGDLLFGD